jgi:alpha/beta superfamily hydrolase
MAGDAPFLALARFPAPLVVLAGGRDEYCPPRALADLGRQLPGATVRVIEGANHFFFGKLFPLGQAVAGWAERLVTGQAGRRRGTG